MTRRRWLTVGVVVVVVAVAVGGLLVVRYLRTDRTTTSRPIEDVVGAYRAATTVAGPTTVTTPSTSTTVVATSASAPSSTAPSTASGPAAAGIPSGVYSYRTSGFDSIDALGGARHDYPATTTITVLADACGVTARWDVAVQRWEQLRWCASPAGSKLDHITSYDEFFGQGNTDDLTCTGDPRPVGAAPGTQWKVSCVQPSDTWVIAGTVAERSTITVGDTAVEVEHVRIVTTYDNTKDVDVTEQWLQLTTGLVVRETRAADTYNGSPIGEVHYQERYTIELMSLQPQR